MILHKLLGMLKSFKKAKKVQKTPFQATLGMLSMPKHAQVVRPWVQIFTNGTIQNPICIRIYKIFALCKKIYLEPSQYINKNGNFQ